MLTGFSKGSFPAGGVPVDIIRRLAIFNPLTNPVFMFDVMSPFKN